MPERTVLFRGLGLAVVDFRCCAAVAGDGPEEPNPTHSIVFVRRGVFRRATEGVWKLADANQVLFFNAGQPYRYGHPLPGGDDCTILTIETQRAVDLVAAHAPRDAESAERPFIHDQALASPPAARAHYELLRLLRCRAPAIAIEDVLGELADAAIASAYADRCQPAARPFRRRQRETIEAVKLELHRRVAQPPSLGELAALVGCSPFRLSRLFSQVEGIGLRRYLGRLRLRLAAERLAGEVGDLTDLALDLGYADHSHFTNAFRREWGMPPSLFRARAAARQRARSAI